MRQPSPSLRDYYAHVERWRSGRLAALTGPEGWLSLTGLEWLEEGSNTIGSDPANRILLPEGKAPARLGTLDLEGGRVTARMIPASGVTSEGRPVEMLALRDDQQGHPTVLRLGTLSFLVIRRLDRLALRIRDSDNPSRSQFRGIQHFPVDPGWRIEARFEPHDPPATLSVPTVLSREETYLVPGSLAFEVNGEPFRLEAFLEPGDTDLFLVFGDLTNRLETFGGGRYLYAKPADDRGVVVLDFNRAYNPPCVFTPHATCPLPLPQNKLAVRIEAGEKRYGALA